MTFPRVRPAVTADTDALTELSRTTFLETYAVHNTPEDMALYLRQSLTADQWAAILANPSHRVLLLEDDMGLAGYTELREGFTPASVVTPKPLELSRLYIRKDRFGRGLGAFLMAALIAEARRQGATALWLGVWQKNERAIAFYRKSGFEVVGTQVFPLGKDLQDDWIMVRDLDRSTP